MDIKVLEKLSRNPHFKLSDFQRKKLEDSKKKEVEENEPLIETNPVNLHDNDVPTHPVKVKRRRKRKYESE